jgi:hypothetical protein
METNRSKKHKASFKLENDDDGGSFRWGLFSDLRE